MSGRETLASEIRMLVKRADTNLAHLARVTGIPRVSLTDIFSGRKLPSQAELRRLLEALVAPPEVVTELQGLHSEARYEVRGLTAAGTAGAGEGSVVITGARNVTVNSPPGQGPQTTGAHVVYGREPLPQYGRPDPLPIQTPSDFVAALAAVHVWAGEPSYRRLENVSNGQLKRSTTSDMLKGTKLPAFDRCTAFLRACGIANIDDWVFTWRRLKALERPETAAWLPGAAG
ncbi:helix-turn-helix transcriptional regulator [Streptomyces sp. Isolate_45]|uniref:helix-turn-helix domain-containing protein n=1 Tax=Streptomyces sp. Isolate_45 TaxID=2950111 RepID=UPI002481A824|nr:helix-turn-helix transcriptional regulator [Streptomyces sp. Isolate_45]MDA5283686.1 helix-turn-helix transcriptional regulator [Streptomyces sp. Isolate_45]